MQVPGETPTRSRSARHAVVRRSTRGPLDDADPLASPTSATTAQSIASPLGSPPPQSIAASPSLSARGPLLSPPPPRSAHSSPSHSPTRSSIDLSILQRPSLYQSLPTTLILPPFLAPSHQPEPGLSLQSLVAASHFRHAAIKAATNLCTGTIPAHDTDAILSTFHARLACLLLSGNIEIAITEARALSDFLSRSTARSQGQGVPASDRVTNRVPWELRLLLHRLQARASGADARRSVMALYALGSECRGHALAAGTGEERVMWAGRLWDLGIRVASELIETGEVDAARRHLASLGDGEGVRTKESLMAKALLEIRTGDIRAAETTAGMLEEGKAEVLSGLIALGKGDIDSASEIFGKLHRVDGKDVLVTNNYAICLLYTGRMEEARSVLEGLVDETQPTTGVLFNLATMYELATEKAVDRKAKLVERVAAKGVDNGGWERAGVEFKL